MDAQKDPLTSGTLFALARPRHSWRGGRCIKCGMWRVTKMTYKGERVVYRQEFYPKWHTKALKRPGPCPGIMRGGGE